MNAEWVTALLTLLSVELAVIAVLGRARWVKRDQVPGNEISFWIEDGVLIIHNRSHEPIFDVLPYVNDAGTGERKAFKYLPGHIDASKNAEDLSLEDARVPFYAVSLPPGLWALELGSVEPDVKQLGLLFENTRGLLFQIEQGRVKTHVGASVADLGNLSLDHTPEVEFTRINENDLGTAFQRLETDRSVTILSSAQEAEAEQVTEQPVRS